MTEGKKNNDLTITSANEVIAKDNEKAVSFSHSLDEPNSLPKNTECK